MGFATQRDTPEAVIPARQKELSSDSGWKSFESASHVEFLEVGSDGLYTFVMGNGARVFRKFQQELFSQMPAAFPGNRLWTTVFKSGRLIIGGESNNYLGYSDDLGVTFTTPVIATQNVYKIIPSNSAMPNRTLFGVGNPMLIRSDDNGTSWAIIQSPVGITMADALSLVRPASLFAHRLILVGSGLTNIVRISDDDGVTFTETLNVPGNVFKSVAYNGKVLVITGVAVVNIFVSSDLGSTWNDSGFTPAQDLWSVCALPNGKFLAVGQSPNPAGTNHPYAVIGSADGLTWTPIDIPFIFDARKVKQIGPYTYIAGSRGSAVQFVAWKRYLGA